MQNVLWITVIGMGLVFVAILLLWGLMALLVRVFADRPVGIPASEPAAPVVQETEPTPVVDDRKQRAAAAAVAVALAMRASKPAAAPPALEHAPSVSAWQAVHRASQMSQRTSGFQKKGVR